MLGIPVFMVSENPVFRQIPAKRERFELSERSTAHTISSFKLSGSARKDI